MREGGSGLSAVAGWSVRGRPLVEGSALEDQPNRKALCLRLPLDSRAQQCPLTGSSVLGERGPGHGLSCPIPTPTPRVGASCHTPGLPVTHSQDPLPGRGASSCLRRPCPSDNDKKLVANISRPGGILLTLAPAGQPARCLRAHPGAPAWLEALESFSLGFWQRTLVRLHSRPLSSSPPFPRPHLSPSLKC